MNTGVVGISVSNFFDEASRRCLRGPRSGVYFATLPSFTQFNTGSSIQYKDAVAHHVIPLVTLRLDLHCRHAVSQNTRNPFPCLDKRLLNEVVQRAR